MVYTYTPAGRLESEVREGQVWYSRYYGYNLDGSRAMVMRDDALNGSHWDMYSYDELSGRLASVQDVWTGEVNGFVWNPEGTLARWSSNEPNSYARVLGYDEEGRLTKIERDYGGGDVQVAYEYGYNSDGARVWKRDVRNGQEYRYICGTGCAAVLKVFEKNAEGTCVLFEDYLSTLKSVVYNRNSDSFVELRLMSGHLLFPTHSSGSWLMIYKDRFGVEVYSQFGVAAPHHPKPAPPLYIETCPPPDVPPPVFSPFPMPALPPDTPNYHVVSSSDEPKCSRDKPNVPKNDPAYERYKKACTRYWNREEQISKYEQTVCATVAICAFMNWALPPIDKDLRPDLYEKCYSPGGAEGIFGYTGPLGCCVECGIRVCFWITQPERDLNNLRLREEWRRCKRKFHGSP